MAQDNHNRWTFYELMTAYLEWFLPAENSQTNELKIYRVSNDTGCCLGGEDVIVFVSKVNKGESNNCVSLSGTKTVSNQLFYKNLSSKYCSKSQICRQRSGTH